MSSLAPPPARLTPARARRPRAHLAPEQPWGLAVLGALALAVLSLLGPSEPTYDPWAWIIWSREVVDGSLQTTAGPSWKPLPVLLTAPFALLGDDVAPSAWLVIARAGGLLALVLAYRLGARLAGRAAGLLSAAFLLLADEFVRNFARGNSEGLLLALVLFGIERHLDGRRAQAFVLGFGAALLRPEVWPFLGLYGLWLAWREPGRRLLVAACFAALVVLWLGPEWWGSGNPFRASDRARQPNPDSSAFAEFPFLDVFRRSWYVLMPPALVGAAIGLAVAWRRRDPLRLAFGAGAAVLMLMVAVMTEAGYAGNLRYVALPAALLCALAGAGWTDLAGAARARFGPRGAVLATALAVAGAGLFVLDDARDFGEDMRLVRDEAVLYGELDRAIAAAGGAAKVRACGAVFTGRFDTMPLAWRLRMPMREVEIFPFGPGTAFATRRFSLTRASRSALGRDPRYPAVAGTERWIVRARCRDAARRGPA